MYVVPSKQIYHCFSCGAGGNAFAFVMNYHKMAFREALEHLADRAAITLTPRAPQKFAAGGQPIDPGEEGGLSRSDLLQANSTAQAFFRAILRHPDHGAAARAIVDRRGLTAEMVEQFQIGAAPDKWDGLALTISSKRFQQEPFRLVGLLKARDSGGEYDAFRNRLMFPIHDQLGRVIGFGGRRINDEDEPKYINSPESPVFDKSRTLYGLFQAAQAIRQSRVAIVTEGYMDTIACHQAGVCNVVATLGTAMTPGNAKLLQRLCETVILLFDGDEAGQRAAERGIEVFFALPVDVKIATLSAVTDAKDPDELLKREGGRAVFDQMIKHAADPLEVLFGRMQRQIGSSGLSARSRAIEDFVARLIDLGLDRVDKLRYQLIIKRLSQIADVSWETVTSLIEGHRRRRGASAAGSRTQTAQDRGEPGSEAILNVASFGPREHLLGCIMNEPSLSLSLGEDEGVFIDADHYEDVLVAGVARAISDILVNGEAASLAIVLSATDDLGIQQAATALARSVERLTEGDAAKLKEFWRDRLQAAHRAAESTDKSDGFERAAESSTAIEDPLDKLQRIRIRRATLPNDTRAVPRPTS